jgi:3-hydroxyacyl-[acyl-carrier-protein] dehydratase
MSDQFTLPIEAQDIMKMLPHRHPFQLVDRVLSYELEPEKKLTALKNVTINEPFFPGHFPESPVMPGVLIIEALAQASGILAFVDRAAENLEPGLYYLVKIDKARFSKTVTPGDQLILEVQQKRLLRNMGLYDGRALVDGKVVASAEILCAGKPSS